MLVMKVHSRGSPLLRLGKCMAVSMMKVRADKPHLLAAASSSFLLKASCARRLASSSLSA